MIYRFHPEAAEELLEACTHYSKISSDLAHAFYTRFENGIEKILAGPRVWPVVEAEVHRFLLHRFPYGIYYVLLDEGSVVFVVAVMHMSREPGYWRDRLKS